MVVPGWGQTPLGHLRTVDAKTKRMQRVRCKEGGAKTWLGGWFFCASLGVTRNCTILCLSEGLKAIPKPFIVYRKIMESTEQKCVNCGNCFGTKMLAQNHCRGRPVREPKPQLCCATYPWDVSTFGKNTKKSHQDPGIIWYPTASCVLISQHSSATDPGIPASPLRQTMTNAISPESCHGRPTMSIYERWGVASNPRLFTIRISSLIPTSRWITRLLEWLMAVTIFLGFAFFGIFWSNQEDGDMPVRSLWIKVHFIERSTSTSNSGTLKYSTQTYYERL